MDDQPGGLPDDLDQVMARAGLRLAQEIGSGTVDRVRVYRGPDLAVRVLVDRGQGFAEAGPPAGEEWFDAETWAACVGLAGAPGPEADASVQLAFLVEHLAQLRWDDDVLACLRDHRRDRARRRLGLDR